MKDNISKMFETSLSVGFIEKKANDYIINSNDACLDKYAGIRLANPTPTAISEYVTESLKNELSGFPDGSVSVYIGALNSENSQSQEENSTEINLSGVAKISVGNKEKVNFEVPFLVVGGELLPFDVIQMNNERVPYTRENVQHIVSAILTAESDGQGPDEYSPYMGIDTERVNPSSTTGFLGDLLRIRDNIGRGKSFANGRMVIAEEQKKILEKIASMKPFTKDDEDKLKEVIAQTIDNAVITKHASVLSEDKATDAMINKIAAQLDKINSINWIDAKEMKHGDVISFVYIKGEELTVPSGIVLEDGLDNDIVKKKGHKYVLADDGRIIDISTADKKMICFKRESQKLPFKFKSKTINELSTGDCFMFIDKDKVSVPMKVDVVSVITVSTAWDNKTAETTRVDFGNGSNGKYDKDDAKSFAFSSTSSALSAKRPIFTKNFSVKEMLSSADMFEKEQIFNTRKSKTSDNNSKTLKTTSSFYTVCGDKKIFYATMEEFARSKHEELGITYECAMSLTNHYPVWEDMICVGENNKVIVISGVIDDYLNNASEIENFVNKEKAESSFDEMMKKASSSDYIEIRRTNKEDELYSVYIRFVDKSQKMFKAVTRKFENLEFYKVKGILKALNFTVNKVAEITNKMKRENFIHYELPENANADLLAGGMESTVAKEQLTKIKKGIFSSNVPDMLAKEIIGRSMAQMIMSNNAVKDTVVSAAKSIGMGDNGGVKQADEKSLRIIKTAASTEIEKKIDKCNILAARFEKIAMDNKSKIARDIAYSMVTGREYMKKIAEVLNGAAFPMFKEVSEDIVSSKKSYEKLASELIDISTHQYIKDDEKVNHLYCRNAVEVLNDMVKFASEVLHADDEIDESMDEARGEDEARLENKVKDLVNGSEKTARELAIKAISSLIK